MDLPPERAAGILSLGGLMALLAKPNQSSPIHRGKFVRERLLCQTLPPPPSAGKKHARRKGQGAALRRDEIAVLRFLQDKV